MTTAAPALTRTVAGAELPGVGTWKLDPGHAEVGFVGRHLMLTKVRGRFRDLDATVEIGDRIEDSRIEATIQMASVDSGNAIRDGHLRSADLFDVDRYPAATFRSTRITAQGSRGSVVGDLTIKDVTLPVELEVEFLGAAVDPWSNQRAGFEARGRINREDWGMTWNQSLDSGSMLVSREIELTLHLELIRQP